ncbi:Ribonuclease G [bacterium HR07]|uniref:Ribonuclease G n=1 Tax=Acetithermum autotrophicum TaxID=1446466 RepID=H5SU81_ACEAU|nr:ribonuclease G [Candidatus Acetothermum autotrophicum]GBC76356.1 Ribonuclease G [bacterium HR07]
MEIHYDHPERLLGNIYKGIVRDILPGIGAAFVDVGLDEKLFLSSKELSDQLWKERRGRKGQALQIQRVLKSGQHIILQVKREGIGTKNPQGTMKISLPGRYWVFLPTDERLGVSRRITDERESRRLKRIAKKLKREGEGLIARTAAQGASEEDLERDFNYLLGTWKGIEEQAQRVKAPALLYRSVDLVRAFLRDRLLDDVQRVVVDSEKTYQEIKDFLSYMHMEKFLDRVELYRGKRPLFEARGIEEQLRESLQPRVRLPGGGSLVIAETEALTAIDVNTGSDVKHQDQEQAILNTNLEAAVEIPRQLRLRKLSGIIIADFVDMKRKDHIEKVIRTLQEELKKDRVPADFVDITKLGLVEITRKREGESLAGMLEEEDES